MEQANWERTLEEFRRAYEASLARGESILGGAIGDAGALERARRMPGATGEALRRAEAAMRAEVDGPGAARPVRAVRSSVQPAVRLTPEAFRYGTLGR